MSGTVELVYAGLPIVAAQASSSMSTTGRRQLPLTVRTAPVPRPPVPKTGANEARPVTRNRVVRATTVNGSFT